MLLDETSFGRYEENRPTRSFSFVAGNWIGPVLVTPAKYLGAWRKYLGTQIKYLGTRRKYLGLFNKLCQLINARSFYVNRPPGSQKAGGRSPIPGPMKRKEGKLKKNISLPIITRTIAVFYYYSRLKLLADMMQPCKGPCSKRAGVFCLVIFSNPPPVAAARPLLSCSVWSIIQAV